MFIYIKIINIMFINKLKNLNNTYFIQNPNIKILNNFNINNIFYYVYIILYNSFFRYQIIFYIKLYKIKKSQLL